MRTHAISLLLISLVTLAQSVAYAAEPSLPPAWQARWQKPSMADRPLQIVHEMQPRRATVSGMQYYLERGLGGVVTNVSFRDYMKSEAAWKTLVTAVESCEKLGMVVWIYDEKGYPSGGAGTLVLDKNPAFEAVELTYDKNRAEPFQIRAAFEYSHAANNFYAARRYPNLIDAAAVECFIDVTHQQYWKRLQRHFGKTIRATFTDEPSLMTVNLGRLSDDVRKKVRVVHQPDPQLPPLPSVPWCDDLPARYKQQFGEDLLAARKSLFQGDGHADRLARRRYWSLISDLIEDRYFGALGRWCESRGIASSGHSLWEEIIMFHAPLEGNALAVLGRMHIPGLDMLSSSPDVVIYVGWMTAALPSSAALLHGRRDVMTEVSDFSQKMADQGPAGLARMQATAAWQAAWGVTVFTLYYNLSDRSVDDSRAYGDFVGRLNAVLQPATPRRRIMLYYPIHDLWEEYRPTAEKPQLESQTQRTRDLARAFMRAGETLQRNQLPFMLCDHVKLSEAKVTDDGRLAMGNQMIEILILPDASKLPPPAAKVVQQFIQRGGRVIRTDAQKKPIGPETIRDALPAAGSIRPKSDHIALGEFTRDGHSVLLLVNVHKDKAYQGSLKLAGGNWLALNPANGSVEAAQLDDNGQFKLKLQPCQTVILVGREQVD